MTEKKKGKILKFSKFGGIILEGEPNDKWFNPDRSIKAQFLELKDDAKGRVIEIDANDKGYFKTFSWPDPEPKGSIANPIVKKDLHTTMDKDDYWTNKEARDIEKEKKISRHGALNTAIEIIKITPGDFSTANEAPTREGTFKVACDLADKILEYVNK